MPHPFRAGEAALRQAQKDEEQPAPHPKADAVSDDGKPRHMQGVSGKGHNAQHHGVQFKAPRPRSGKAQTHAKQRHHSHHRGRKHVAPQLPANQAVHHPVVQAGGQNIRPAAGVLRKGAVHAAHKGVGVVAEHIRMQLHQPRPDSNAKDGRHSPRPQAARCAHYGPPCPRGDTRTAKTCSGVLGAWL